VKTKSGRWWPRRARFIDVLEDAGKKTLKYLYDFGNGWSTRSKSSA
jgi:hypothetical protein